MEEVEDLIMVRWGRFGEWLNCPYCLGSWVGLSLFGLFHWSSELTAFMVSAFLIPGVLVRVLQLFPVPPATQPTVPQEEAEAAPTAPDEEDHEFPTPFKVQKQILAIKDNPKAHQELLKRNSFLLTLLHNAKSCPNQECATISENYQKEIQALESRYADDPKKCPSCTRGTIINKYFFMLYNLLGEQEVSLMNPNPPKEASPDATPFTTAQTDETDKETE